MMKLSNVYSLYVCYHNVYITYIPTYVSNCPSRRGIRGTHLESFIQDIVDEVAPIKKAPLWGWGPIHSNVTSLD